MPNLHEPGIICKHFFILRLANVQAIGETHIKITGFAVAKTILGYAVALALLAGGMTYVKYRFLLREFSAEFTIGLFALVFTALGVWIGSRLTRKRPSGAFQRNDAAIRSLGMTPREVEVLELMTSGRSNEEIAAHLSISLHTVKTHVSSILSKMDATRRTQAIDKARTLNIVR